jgi:hypothetical protein
MIGKYLKKKWVTVEKQKFISLWSPCCTSPENEHRKIEKIEGQGKFEGQVLNYQFSPFPSKVEDVGSNATHAHLLKKLSGGRREILSIQGRIMV